MNTHEKTYPQGYAQGAAVIAKLLKTMPMMPGVYRMLDESGKVLYVGKAKELKKRVTAYIQPNRLPDRIKRMVSLTTAMEIITTHTEAEALLLEANLIKRYLPRFNILLRDDKSYPWLMIGAQPFPQVSKQRGKMVKGAFYWGPFASARAVDKTLNVLQRVFGLRTCEDSVFVARKRPCLLYQIKRCSAPCVEKISQDDYKQAVEEAKGFLRGKAPEVHQHLVKKMEQAAEALAFERAAALRDQIQALSYVQQNTGIINPASLHDADVIALYSVGGQTCVQVFFIRGGRNNGNRAFFPSYGIDEYPEDEVILASFVSQFYEDKIPPAEILLSHTLHERVLIQEALCLKREKKVELTVPQRGEKLAVVNHALSNAREALERKIAEEASQKLIMADVQKTFNLNSFPKRIEVYDNSHVMGTHAYGVMIVATPEGFERTSYRKFSIKGEITPGDDFGMMKEVLERRFGRALTARKNGEDKIGWPDMVLIDGGSGQLKAVQNILDTLGVTDVKVVAIAKGVDRNAGREWFHTKDAEPFQLPLRSPLLYYLQRLRDEAHRFAITTHRAGRSKNFVQSELDQITGIGSVRKKALLHRFGSVRAIKQAGLQDLEATPGINKAIATEIYGYFHPDWHHDSSV